VHGNRRGRQWRDHIHVVRRDWETDVGGGLFFANSGATLDGCTLAYNSVEAPTERAVLSTSYGGYVYHAVRELPVFSGQYRKAKVTGGADLGQRPMPCRRCGTAPLPATRPARWAAPSSAIGART